MKAAPIMPKKRITYAKPEIGKEEFVRHLFSMYAGELGFEIVNIQKAFPDCVAIDCRHNGRKKVNIELEYEAGNFALHGHDKQMDPDETYLVVCWSPRGIDLIPAGIEVIVLSEDRYKIEVADYPADVLDGDESDQPLYRVIGFKTAMADEKPFSFFENTRMFRTNIKFKDNHLPKGSVIVLYEKGWLIGEFTVEKFIHLERGPETDYEKRLYELISFPVTIDETPLVYDKWVKGHFLYNHFKVYDPKVNFKILGRNMSHGGSLNLSFDELQMIRGNKKFTEKE